MRKVLRHNAGHRALFINKALDTCPDADKASDKPVFEKTQEVVKDEVRDKLGERLANNIANTFKAEANQGVQREHSEDGSAARGANIIKHDTTRRVR